MQSFLTTIFLNTAFCVETTHLTSCPKRYHIGVFFVSKQWRFQTTFKLILQSPPQYLLRFWLKGSSEDVFTRKYCWSNLEIIQKKENPDILGFLSSKGGLAGNFLWKIIYCVVCCSILTSEHLHWMWLEIGCLQLLMWHGNTKWLLVAA